VGAISKEGAYEEAVLTSGPPFSEFHHPWVLLIIKHKAKVIRNLNIVDHQT
jgi:hypothetical protein